MLGMVKSLLEKPVLHRGQWHRANGSLMLALVTLDGTGYRGELRNGLKFENLFRRQFQAGLGCSGSDLDIKN